MINLSERSVLSWLSDFPPWGQVWFDKQEYGAMVGIFALCRLASNEMIEGGALGRLAG